MPHSSTKGRFLEKCLKSDKVRKAIDYFIRNYKEVFDVD